MIFPPNNLPLNSRNWGRTLENRLVAIQSNFKSAEINNLARDSQSLSNFARLDVAVTNIIKLLTDVELITETTTTLEEDLDSLGVDLTDVTGNIYFPGTTQLNGSRLRVGTVVADTIAAGYVYAGKIVGGQIDGGIITGTTVQTAGPSRIVLNNSARSLQFTDAQNTVVANMFSGTSQQGNPGIFMSYGNSPQVNAANLFSLRQESFFLSGGSGNAGTISGSAGGVFINATGSGSAITLDAQAGVAITNGSLTVAGGVRLGGVNGTLLSRAGDGRVQSDGGFLSSGNLGVTGNITYVAPQGTGTTFPLYWNSSTNVLYRLSSSERYKTDIKNAEIDYEKFMQVQPRTFKNKKDAEEFGLENTELTYGYIAEEMHDLGLTDFVVYEDDENGNSRPESVNYMSMAIATHALIKHQDTLIKSLEARLTALETQ
jgi:hypothetical protein